MQVLLFMMMCAGVAHGCDDGGVVLRSMRAAHVVQKIDPQDFHEKDVTILQKKGDAVWMLDFSHKSLTLPIKCSFSGCGGEHISLGKFIFYMMTCGVKKTQSEWRYEPFFFYQFRALSAYLGCTVAESAVFVRKKKMWSAFSRKSGIEPNSLGQLRFWTAEGDQRVLYGKVGEMHAPSPSKAFKPLWGFAPSGKTMQWRVRPKNSETWDELVRDGVILRVAGVDLELLGMPVATVPEEMERAVCRESLLVDFFPVRFQEVCEGFEERSFRRKKTYKVCHV